MPPKSKAPRCTACNKQIHSSFDAKLHPLLATLVCRKCCDAYGTGDFSQFDDGVDSNGDDNYCRWCVDGGELYFCGNTEQPAKCHYAFCQDCIARNCPRDEVLHFNHEDSNWRWICLACDITKLKEHRRRAQTVIVSLNEKDLKRGTVSSSTSKETLKEASKTMTREPSARQTLKETSSTSSSTREAPKESVKEATKVVEREPEAKSLPPLEIPRQAKTSLRNLGPRVSLGSLASSSLTSITNSPTKRATPVTPSSASKTSTATISTGISPTSSTPSSSVKSTTPVAVSRPTPPLVPKPILITLTDTKTDAPIVIPSNGTKSAPTATKPASSSIVKLTASPTTIAQQTPLKDAHQTAVLATTQPSTSKTTHTNTTTTTAVVANNNTTATTQQAPSKVVPKPNSDGAVVVSKSSVPLKSRQTVSKQLKVNSEQVVPRIVTNESPKVVLSETELKTRLENFGNLKKKCLEEIDVQFSTVLEMFESIGTENKALLSSEIDSMKRPIEEITNMVVNLKKLCHSQI